MKTNTPASTESYASAYSRLSAIAEKLKGAGATADLDEVVTLLREARAAHAICKSRLEIVRREVDAEVEAAGGLSQA